MLPAASFALLPLTSWPGSEYPHLRFNSHGGRYYLSGARYSDVHRNEYGAARELLRD